jgi:hypothetical protein
MIRTAFETTMAATNTLGVPVENWLAPFYQYCNRITALHFLVNECHPQIPARLLFIYFYGDTNKSAICPKDMATWETGIEQMYTTIGIDENSAIAQRVHNIFLPVNPDVKVGKKSKSTALL